MNEMTKTKIEEYATALPTVKMAYGVRETVKIVWGKKFAKLHADGGVLCFVGMEDGLIYKPASWKAPELNFPRGSVYDRASWDTYTFNRYNPEDGAKAMQDALANATPSAKVVVSKEPKTKAKKDADRMTKQTFMDSIKIGPATYGIGSDCYPYEVVAKNGLTILVRALSYDLKPTNAPIETLRVSIRNGRPAIAGDRCGRWSFGFARFYNDPSF